MLWALFILSVASLAQAQHASCDHYEWKHLLKANYSSCDTATNTRILKYVIREDIKCEPKPTAPTNELNVSCDCTFDDFDVEYGPCNQGRRPFKEWKKVSDCTGGVSGKLPAYPANAAAALCACDADSLHPSYSECENGKRRVLWHYATQCMQTEDMPLSDELSCDTSCQDGYFIAPPLTECKTCDAGTFSTTSGNIPSLSDHDVEDFISTQCTITEGVESESSCDPWKQNGTREYYSRPGYEAHGAVSVLEWRPAVIHYPSNLTFEYIVSSEANYDGLVVFLNDEQIDFGADGSSDPSFASGTWQKTWRKVVVALDELPVGRRHAIQFVYKKDGDTTKGEDMVRLRDISVTGLMLAATACQPCPKGHISIPGQPCTPCPANTYTQGNSSTCTPCPDDEYAPTASNKCFPRPPCKATDFIPVYEKCSSDAKRKMSYKLITDRCKGGFPKPEDKMVDCPVCPGGSYRNGQECTPCPSGQASSASEDQCHVCPEGTVGIKAVNYPDFSSMEGDLPANWKADNHIFEAIEDGDGTTVILTQVVNSDNLDGPLRLIIDFDLYMTGWIEFTYSMNYTGVPDNVEAYMPIYIDGNIEDMRVLTNYGDTELELRGSYMSDDIKPGHHNITIGFECYYAEECRLSLRSLSISGVPQGGASECLPCLKGHECTNGDTQTPCKPGTFNPNIASKCEPCTGNNITRTSGALECVECSPVTRPNVDHSQCETTCKFGLPEQGKSALNNYDFSGLKDTVFGPITRQQGAPHAFGFLDLDQDFIKSYDAHWTKHLYFLSPCSIMPQNIIDAVCPDMQPGQENDVQPSYACERITYSWSHGVGLSLQSAELIDPKDKYSGLVFHYGEGDRCHTADKPRRTVLYAHCNLSTPVDNQKITLIHKGTDSSAADYCEYSFRLDTPYACPACEMSDYHKVDSACSKDGMKRSNMILKENVQCFGPSPLYNPGIETTCDPCTEADIISVPGECNFDTKTRKVTYVFAENCSRQEDQHPPAPITAKCDTCGPEDYDWHLTECIDDEQYSVPTRKKDATCQEDAGHPMAPVLKSCDVLKEFVVGKYHGMDIWIFVAILVALFALLAMCVGLLWRNSSHWKAQYQAIQLPNHDEADDEARL